MKMNLRRIFKDYRPGDIATGAVHTFGLNSAKLSDDSEVDMGIYPILEKRRDSNGNDQWVFNGYF